MPSYQGLKQLKKLNIKALVYLQTQSSSVLEPVFNVPKFPGHGLHSLFKPATSLYVFFSHFSHTVSLPSTSINFSPTLQLAVVERYAHRNMGIKLLYLISSILCMTIYTKVTRGFT